ncbi:glutathione S-transferase family protein [Devosia sp. MC532]|uniref:glutathione S-transferase family protein n=1 Tax=Devosia sp. MC532 TaxID=2799788 RepID=UPI0018F62FF3|nr:glutathione S-transferase family protein [Devosia sp. MC532]MBJ7578714.1 glutathione S-transferase family protein [Devosia sp. MC532]
MAERVLYYTPNLNPRVAVAVARHLNAQVQYKRYAPMGADKDAFLGLNPNSLAPLLVEDGVALWETDAIAMRLIELTGSDFWPDEHRVEMMKWVSWSAHHFTKIAGDIVFYNYTAVAWQGEPDPKVVEELVVDFHRFASILDAELSQREWLVGGRMSYADFRVASALPFAVQGKLPLEDYSHIRRWHDQLMDVPAWKEPFADLA